MALTANAEVDDVEAVAIGRRVGRRVVRIAAMLVTALVVTVACVFILAAISAWLSNMLVIVAAAALLCLVIGGLDRWLGPQRTGASAARGSSDRRSELAVMAGLARIVFVGSIVILVVAVAKFIRGDTSFALVAGVAGGLGCLSALQMLWFARRLAARALSSPTNEP
jgi:hypothetical protein